MKLSRTFGYLLAMTIVCIGLMAFGADHANASHAVTLASLTGFDPNTLAMLPAAAGMAGSTSKAKRFRVATSGPTIDGREIKPEWLKQAADNYILDHWDLWSSRNAGQRPRPYARILDHWDLWSSRNGSC